MFLLFYDLTGSSVARGERLGGRGKREGRHGLVALGRRGAQELAYGGAAFVCFKYKFDVFIVFTCCSSEITYVLYEGRGGLRGLAREHPEVAGGIRAVMHARPLWLRQPDSRTAGQPDSRTAGNGSQAYVSPSRASTRQPRPLPRGRGRPSGRPRLPLKE